MVMILLNLSYIPDEVVKEIRFDQPGWSEVFKNNMDDYKKKFNDGALEFLGAKEDIPQPKWKLDLMK